MAVRYDASVEGRSREAALRRGFIACFGVVCEVEGDGGDELDNGDVTRCRRGVVEGDVKPRG